MRLKLWTAFLALGIFLSFGWQVDGLPFMPGSLFSDAAIAHYPAALHIQKQGIDSVWSELSMGGQPFSANPLNKTAYPLQVLALFIPPLLHLNLLIFVHFGIALVGMWRWVRQIGLSEPAAALAALSYGLAPRLISHLGAGHLDLFYALAWFPWLMAAVRHLSQHPKLYAALVCALTAALVLLADVRTALFAYATALLYGAALAISTRRYASAIWSLAALLLTGLLVAPVVIPVLLWQPYLTRSTMTPLDSGVFSLLPGQLLGLWLAPPAGDVERQTFVGLPVLILGLIAVISDTQRVRGWILLGVLAGWYALGDNSLLWQTLNWLVPALNWFRVPARAWFIIALVMPLLAAYGFDALSGSARQRIQRLLAILMALMLAGGAGFTILVPTFAQSGLRLLSIGALTCLVLSIGLRQRHFSRPMILMLMIVLAVDLGWNARQWLEWRRESEWLTPYQALSQTLQADHVDRLYSPSYAIPQQAAAAHEIELFGGVDPFQLSGIVDAIAQASGVDSSGYSVVQPPLNDVPDSEIALANRGAVINTVVLAAWQVSHVAAGYPIDHERLTALDGSPVNSIYLYRNLDYQPTLTPGTIPRWPEYSGLPSSAQVESLNNTTRSIQQLGRALFGIVLAVTGLRYLRMKRT